MDGDDMRKDKWKKFLRQKQFMFAAGLMVVAAVGMTGIYVSEQTARSEQREEQTEPDGEKYVTGEEVEPDTEAAEDVSNILLPETAEPQAQQLEQTEPAVPMEEASESVADEAGAAVSAGTTTANLNFSESSELLWPLQGNVIMNYSMDQTIYYATLDSYRYNPAVIIAGEVNDKVICAADGIITDISTNEETGCTVTMDLGNGYSAVYGQLKEVPFHAGAYVEAGDVLGYVSEPTKYYSVEGSNLYFALRHGEETVDPITFFE